MHKKDMVDAMLGKIFPSNRGDTLIGGMAAKTYNLFLVVFE